MTGNNRNLNTYEFDLDKYTYYLQQYQTYKIKDDLTYKELTQKKQNKLTELLRSKKKGAKKFFQKHHRYYYMNPSPMVSIIETILKAASAFKLSKQKTHPFTILHHSWHTTLEELEEDFEGHFNLKAIRGLIYHALLGKDYFGMIELAFLKDGVIAVHFHGMLWPSITDTDKARINSCFKGGEEEDQPGFYTKPAEDMIKAFTYLVKPPVSQYAKTDSKKKHNPLSKKKCRRLATVMKQHRIMYSDLMVAAGEGKYFKHAVVEYLTKQK